MQELKQYEQVCNKLSNYFVNRYFGKNTEVFWVAEEIGGCLSVNDYFFNMSDIKDYIKYHYTAKQMFEYYEYELKEQENKSDYVICIRDFKKSNLYKNKK